MFWTYYRFGTCEVKHLKPSADMLELGIPTLDALFADLPELFRTTAEAWGHEENGMFMNTTVRVRSSAQFLR